MIKLSRLATRASYFALLTSSSSPNNRVRYSAHSFPHNDTKALDTSDLLAPIAKMSPKTMDIADFDILEQLTSCLHERPEDSQLVWAETGVVPSLVVLQGCGVLEIEQEARLLLSLVGYAPPYAGRGLRILSIDGGGTR